MKFSPTPDDEGDLEAVKHLEFPPLLVHKRPHFNESQVSQIQLRINILHKEYTVKLLNQKCEEKSYMFEQVCFKFSHFNKNHVNFQIRSMSLKPPGGISRFWYNTQLPFEHAWLLCN